MSKRSPPNSFAGLSFGDLSKAAGLYCKAHHPPSQKAKQDARDAARRAENQMIADQRERRDAIAKAERAIIDAVMACKSEVEDQHLAPRAGEGSNFVESTLT